MPDKRVLYTVAISMGILLVWTKFLMPKPEPAKPPVAGAPVVASPIAATAGDGGTAVGPAAPNAPNAPVAPVAELPPPPADRPAAELSRIEQAGLYKSEWSTWGAAPTLFELSHPRFRAEYILAGGKTELRQIQLVDTKGPFAPLVVTLPDSGIELSPEAAWQKLPSAEGALSYAWENPQVRVEKHYTFPTGSYEVRLKVTVENKSNQALSVPLQLALSGWQDPSAKPGGMFSAHAAQTEGMCDLNGKLKNKDFASLRKAPLELVGQVKWVGIDRKYFIAAMAAGGAEEKKCHVSALADGTITATLRFAERTIAPKTRSEWELGGFFGPKVLAQLDDVKVGGQDARLGDAVDYGWKEVLARPMLAVLKAVHYVVPNWGFAIIVLTLLIKAVTWWPTQKSMKSMREMSKLKPEIDKLKARFGEDKQKFNAAMMALYKERGVNPLGGCLPMLIQMPMYIALYSMLGASVELYRSGFLYWIKDLTAADPYYVTPLLTGAIMFLQQRLTPASPDTQQKAMMYLMPVMFTAFSVFLPAGLTIYILTNTLLSMGQQWLINRADGPLGKPAKAS